MKTFLLCMCFASLGLAVAQQTADKPSFEVASIKPSDPNPSNAMWIGMNANQAIVQYTNITLKDCIRAAYRVRDFQIVGPDWITKARFEINAKLPVGASSDQIPEMLQALLAERFKLVLQHDTKEKPVYALTVGNGGPRLKPADETKIEKGAPMAVGPDGKPRQAMKIQVSASQIVLTAPSASLSSFVDLLSRFTMRPVIDTTGLEGQYGFHLSFAPETTQGIPTSGSVNPEGTPTSSDPAPSVFEAVQRYGLRLEARKASLEMLTITHVEKMPTQN